MITVQWCARLLFLVICCILTGYGIGMSISALILVLLGF